MQDHQQSSGAGEASTSITVRYTQGTYVARARGHKATASCVYCTDTAAKSLARKLGSDPEQHWAGTTHGPKGSVYLFIREEVQA